MSNILNSEDFGLKIYNRFPPKYREDDVGQNFALKRYLQSLSDGGFKHSIDDINGITNLIDPDRVDAKVLPILFKQYGLEVFNGIPEEYLRYLLPKLGEAWSKKGSLSVVEFITSSLSGVKVTTEVSYDENENPTIDVKFEMDYSIGNYFPSAEHFSKLLKNFLPFYCDANLIYTYGFYDDASMRGRDSIQDRVIFLPSYESRAMRTTFNTENTRKTAVLGEAVMGVAVFDTRIDYIDTHIDNIIGSVESGGRMRSSSNSLTNNASNTTNNNLYTNGLYEYDKVTVNNDTEVVIN